jgi:hypothetical protein
MTAPYRPGQEAVALFLVDEGVRVHETRIYDAYPDALEGRWHVSHELGETIVDGKGEGAYLLPLNDELRAELQQHGDGYLVESTERDVLWERGDDLGQDGLGYER